MPLSPIPAAPPRGTHCRQAWLDAAPDGALRYAFPGRPEHAADARQIVRDLFTGTGREDDAALIVAELVGNALLYTRSGQVVGWFGLEIAFGALVRVAIADLGGAGWLIGAPAANTPAHEEPSSPPLVADPDGHLDDLNIPGLDGIVLGGRGLTIIAALAVTTGACGSPTTGHTVWADLDVGDPPEPSHKALTA